MAVANEVGSPQAGHGRIDVITSADLVWSARIVLHDRLKSPIAITQQDADEVSRDGDVHVAILVEVSYRDLI